MSFEPWTVHTMTAIVLHPQGQVSYQMYHQSFAIIQSPNDTLY